MGFDEVERVVGDMERRYRPDALHVRFLGSHDTSRMASRAAVDPARDCRWQGGGACAQLAGTPRDPEVYRRLQRAFAALMTMPGLSLLYYGDEIALAGGNDPDNRRNMAWDGGLAQWALGVATPTEAQLALREWVGALGRAKQQHPALRAGRRVPLLVEPDLYVYARATPDDLAVVVLNRGGAVADRRITGFAAVGEAHDLTAIVGRADAVVDGDALTVSIPAGGAAVLVRTGGGP
jgi:glycosidase